MTGVQTCALPIYLVAEHRGALLAARLDAYDYYTSEAGGKKGSAMLGDEMIDEASRKMALVIAGKGRAAGMQRTDRWTPPED